MAFKKILLLCALVTGTAVAQPDAGGSSNQNNRHEYDEVSEWNPFAISLHNSNYILPWTHASEITNPVIPVFGEPLQELKQTELSFQLSFKLPLFESYFTEDTKLYFAYTQLTFWQLYTHDAFIRETNYEPEFFITHYLTECSKISLGVDHESNGRGGFFERSWNRVYLDYNIELNRHFWFSVQPWIIAFKSNSSDEHNPDIGHFLGHDQFILGMNFGDFVANFRLTNIESGFRRGQRELDIGYRLFHKWYLFGQVFSGYGRSLIEYNNSSTAFGIGLALNV